MWLGVDARRDDRYPARVARDHGDQRQRGDEAAREVQQPEDRRVPSGVSDISQSNAANVSVSATGGKPAADSARSRGPSARSSRPRRALHRSNSSPITIHSAKNTAARITKNGRRSGTAPCARAWRAPRRRAPATDRPTDTASRATARSARTGSRAPAGSPTIASVNRWNTIDPARARSRGRSSGRSARRARSTPRTPTPSGTRTPPASGAAAKPIAIPSAPSAPSVVDPTRTIAPGHGSLRAMSPGAPAAATSSSALPRQLERAHVGDHGPAIVDDEHAPRTTASGRSRRRSRGTARPVSARRSAASCSDGGRRRCMLRATALSPSPAMP